MNSKMTKNSQLSTTKSKKQKQKQTKQTTRTGTESQVWRSFAGLSAGKGNGKRENGGKGAGFKKHNWQLKNRQENVKNSTGNGEVKKLICTTHGYELRVGAAGGKGCTRWREVKGKNQDK